MNLRRILLSSVAALTLTSVAAFAADDAAVNGGAVQVAQDQTGDYLVFPAYYANTQGWSTNIKVVNTNETHAVVAKVVIREYMSSAEKLDFPIYLTPGDVWEATIKNVGGKVYISSTDDSMFNNGAPASDVNPVNQALFDAVVGSQDNSKGYVEVFGFAAIDAATVTGVTGWTKGNPLDKAKLYADYNANLNGGANTGARWIAVDNDSLYGQEVISAANANGNLAMTLMATAFENVTGSVANTKVVLATDSTLINNTAQVVANLTLVGEVEDALQKSDIFTTYYDASSTAAAETSLLLTQPMKKYRYADTPATLTSAIGYAAAATVTGPMSYSFKYTPLARDQKENSLTSTVYYSGGTSTTYTCNTEICQISVGDFVGSYTKGYVDFNLGQTGHTSMPVISTVMTAANVGGTNVTNIISPAYK